MKKLIALLVVVFALFVLVGCAPADLDKAKAKMEDAGYKAIVEKLDKTGEDGEVGYLQASKGEGLASAIVGALDGDILVAVLYDSASNAKKAFNKAKEDSGDKMPSNAQVVGKWIIYGSDAAVKAFK